MVHDIVLRMMNGRQMMKDVLQKVKSAGRTALTEAEAKQALAGFGLPFPGEQVCHSLAEAKKAAADMGFPVVAKGIGPELLHKTEAGVVILNIRNEAELEEAYNGIKQRGGDLVQQVLIQQFVEGQREFVVGMSRDPQFGPSVMFGLGGIFTEALGDVTFRIAPLTRGDALAMLDEPKSSALLGAVRGMAAVNREHLADILLAVSDICMKHPEIAEMDFNPVKVTAAGTVHIVDALVTLAD